MRKINNHLRKIFAVLAVGVILAGCAANYPLPVRGDENIFRRSAQADIFPGNHPFYSMGTFQTKENFENVERAQWNVKPKNSPRVWINITTSQKASPVMGNMQSYFPFDVRWKLKDGREFILKNIDVRSLSNDYLQKNPIRLQWQREGRPRERVGDGEAILTFEVKDDTVLLKWVVEINQTPPGKRLTATGAATKWDFKHEEYLMATLKGKPTSGINFSIQDE